MARKYIGKTTSIARKINAGFWFDSLLRMFLFDAIGLALALVGVAWYWEDNLPGRVIERTVTGYTYDDFAYMVTLSDGSSKSLFVSPVMEYIYPAIIIITGLQLVLLFLSLFRTGRIRRKLRPLNDLAIKAEEISRVPFDDSKMQQLEAAISNVSADDDEVRIKTGDKELASIEIALNGLLQRMKDAQKQQSRFVSDASHELRTPISVIQGYVSMLDRWGKEDPEVLEESIEALKNESDHMKELIEQLLFLARGDSGRNTLHYAEVNLRHTMQEVWEESLMIDEKHHYEYRNALPEEEEEAGQMSDASDTYIINADEAMIKQSIRILVQNAAKYSGEGDKIVLDVKKENGQICYIVQDEGVGMAEEDVVHIFERFYRSDKARNSGTGGSGLGLSIAKWILDAHNATIEVLSRPDFGTRFTIKFAEKIKNEASGN